MAEPFGDLPFASPWLRPEDEENDLRRYASTLRERWKLVVIAVLVATAAAVVYVTTATPVYTAQAQLLVSPLNGNTSNTLAGLGLISQSSDPTQDVETGASVVPSLKAAQLTGQRLRLPDTPQQILARVNVQIISQSFILAVSATADNKYAAAALANAFARAALTVRTAAFQAALGQKIAGLKAQVTNATGAGTTGAVRQQLASLEAYQGAQLPDMTLSNSASPPTSLTSPRVALSLVAAIVAGLVVGILGAFGLEAFDSTLRREDQLSRLFRLPVLARIPLEGKHRWRPLPRRRPDAGLSPAAIEAYRTLRVMILASTSRTGGRVRSIFVTSASPSEGKSTIAISLATSLASSGASTILIEADMRKPTVGQAVGIKARNGLAEVLTGRIELARALVSSPAHPDQLKFLLGRSTSQRGIPSGDVLFLPTVSELFSNAEKLAEYVVIDSPPLLAVIDALDLACDADAVLVVARIGETNTKRLAALGELLERSLVHPVGIALVGAETPGGTDDYYYTHAETDAQPDIQEATQAAVDKTIERMSRTESRQTQAAADKSAERVIKTENRRGAQAVKDNTAKRTPKPDVKRRAAKEQPAEPGTKAAADARKGARSRTRPKPRPPIDTPIPGVADTAAPAEPEPALATPIDDVINTHAQAEQEAEPEAVEELEEETESAIDALHSADPQSEEEAEQEEEEQPAAEAELEAEEEAESAIDTTLQPMNGAHADGETEFQTDETEIGGEPVSSRSSNWKTT